MLQEQRENHSRLYRDFSALIPGFSDIAFQFEKDPPLMTRFVEKVSYSITMTDM
jgi:hypothetical protein